MSYPCWVFSTWLCGCWHGVGAHSVCCGVKWAWRKERESWVRMIQERRQEKWKFVKICLPFLLLALREKLSKADSWSHFHICRRILLCAFLNSGASVYVGELVPGPPTDNKIWACSRRPWCNWPSISAGSLSVGSASMNVGVPLYHLPSSRAAVGSESEHAVWFRGLPTTCTLQHESYLSVASEKTTENSPFARRYFPLLSLGVEGEYKEVLWLRKTFLLNDTGSLDTWWLWDELC